MNQNPVKLGPLALLLTVISICLTTLAILNFTTARADTRLAEKYAETVRTRYALEIQGQEYLRDLGEKGPEGTPDENGVIWHEIEQDGSRLRIGLRPDGEEYTVTAWKQEREWTADLSMGNLWLGN